MLFLCLLARWMDSIVLSNQVPGLEARKLQVYVRLKCEDRRHAYKNNRINAQKKLSCSKSPPVNGTLKVTGQKRRRWIALMAAVLPTAVVLLLAQLSHQSFQLFARLLLLLQKLLHPLVLLF